MYQAGEASESAADISSCAREPIHIPGSIQPHGVLLAIDPSDFTVRHISQNCIDWFGEPHHELLGLSLLSLLSTTSAEVFLREFNQAGVRINNPLKLEFIVKTKPLVFDVIAHRSQNLLFLELEPTTQQRDLIFTDVYKRVSHAIEDVVNATSLETLFQKTVHHAKALSNYQRVMIYAFDKDWNGKVVAEDCEPDQQPFLGLQYPASDIPEQARRLYLSNWLRIIPRVSYQPAQIVPPLHIDTNAPLDLSQCVLRSVSPIHIQYLKNMGVGASLSVSIIKEGQLWGLIAMHHNGDGFLPYEIRQGLEFLGKCFSLQLATKEQHENIERKQYLASLDPLLHRSMLKEPLFIDGLWRSDPSFLHYVDGAIGGAILQNDRLILCGQTPSETQVRELTKWLLPNLEPQVVFHTDKLPALYAQAGAYKETVSGLLAVSIPEIKPCIIMWFKPEVIQTVNWGGNPNKPEGDLLQSEPLSPRRSFALWQEEVKRTSLPFAAEEIQAVGQLRRTIIEVDLQWQVKLAMESNAELDQFASVISHDLKEPLRGIRHYSEFLQEDLGTSIKSECLDDLKGIQQLSDKALSLLVELYEFSRIGQIQFAFEKTDLNTVLDDIKGRLHHYFDSPKAELIKKTALPVFYCDRVRIGEVFYNLILNGLKYNNKPNQVIEVGSYEQNGKTVFYVRDNGIGISEHAQLRVFRIFQRLHDQEAYGGGTGVGLAIVKRIVERHGGRIWLESQAGLGTTFKFTLQPK